jgi:hypothetical protein
MNRFIAVGALLAIALFVCSAALADADPNLKSGPQVGENGRPKPFTPLNLNGPTPDQKQCLV